MQGSAPLSFWHSMVHFGLPKVLVLSLFLLQHSHNVDHTQACEPAGTIPVRLVGFV